MKAIMKLREYDILLGQSEHEDKEAVIDDERVFTYGELRREINLFSTELNRKKVLLMLKKKRVLRHLINFLIPKLQNIYQKIIKPM